MKWPIRETTIVAWVVVLALSKVTSAEQADKSRSECTFEKLGSKLHKEYSVTAQIDKDQDSAIDYARLLISQKVKAMGCDRYAVISGTRNSFYGGRGLNVRLVYMIFANDDINPFPLHGSTVEYVIGYPGEQPITPPIKLPL